jgi:hypothetical protein
MIFDIISTIEVPTTKYWYELKPDGTRSIDIEHGEEETFIFKFDSISNERIIFREGPPVLRVDGKEMYFDMKNNSLRSIHFEDEEHIWIVKNPRDLLAQCREAYLRQKITERFLGIMDESPVSSDKEELTEILDEFELSGKIEDEGSNNDTEDYLDE